MAIDWLLLLTFVPASLALNLTPGADMMFCAGQGLRAGPAAAWRASGGVALGGLIHATVAGLGVGSLVAAHPGALQAIRWIGAGYLLWMAWQILRAEAAGPDLRPARPFRDGLLVNLTNPKVILFILAFVPQFIDAAAPLLPQFLLYGAVLSLGGFVVNGLAGALAGLAQARLSGQGVWLRRVSAGIFTLLALRLVLGERS
ncbi:Threonine/homoserine/homoserine lactone efflux protein [Pseudooceanicola antarcticus]|uniref:LysE family translocator n=1 Tax=Pseudooceanicola antarcticus TaxID=1247613 RepID=A0A285IQZ3_9RHOB|nr:LysE family translocator [Pseudooceanicola antarcticus]PJE31810.1 LysE family translocator [Pseudooceanicola antarcticus]SNY50440.1 Threonine/homoserine/homoserine lactone efflux protein [Pseudooceanicola antarcticus]